MARPIWILKHYTMTHHLQNAYRSAKLRANKQVRDIVDEDGTLRI